MVLKLKIRKSELRGNIEASLLIVMLYLSVLTTFVNASLNMPLYLLQILLFIYYIANKRILKALDSWKFILLFSLSILLTTFFNRYYDGSLTLQVMWRSVRIALTPLLGFFFARRNSQNVRKKLYWGIYFSMLTAIVYGFYQYFAGIGWGHNTRMDSFFGHPITYCSILIVTFWLTFYLFDSKNYRTIFSVYIIMGILSTGSRSGWLALLGTLIIALIFNRKYVKIKAYTIYWAISVVILLFIFLFTEYFVAMITMIGQRFTGMMESASATQRLGSITYVIANLLERSNILNVLFGHGAGGATELMKGTTITLDRFYTTDNQYITLIYDYGIVSIIFLVLLLGTIFKVLSSFTVKSKELKGLCYCIIGGGLIPAFFYEFFGWLSSSTLILLLIGMFLCLRKESGCNNNPGLR